MKGPGEIGLFVKVLCLQANGKGQLEREKFMMQKREGTFRRKVSEELRGSLGISGGLASDGAETWSFVTEGVWRMAMDGDVRKWI